MSQHSDSARPAQETFVVVHAVDESGATAERIGTATLVDAEFALASRPLTERLARQPTRVRVGIFAVWNSADPAVGERDTVADLPGPAPLSVFGEVVDVAEIRVLEEDSELVLLELAGESRAPALIPDRPRPDPSRREVVDALRAVLDGTPLPDWVLATRAPGPHFIGNPIHWFRIIFGWG